MPNRSHSFLSGYLLARNARFWQLAVQLRWLTLVAAALTIATELVIRYLGMHVQPAQLPQVLAALPWETLEHGARAAYTWLALLTLLGWAKQRLNHPFRWLPYCTEAVFPWYILHQSLIIVMLYWLMPLQLNAWLEPALVIAATVIGCLALHESVIRRVRWLRPLSGLTGPSPATTPAPAAPPDIRPMKASTCRYLCC